MKTAVGSASGYRPHRGQLVRYSAFTPTPSVVASRRRLPLRSTSRASRAWA